MSPVGYVVVAAFAIAAASGLALIVLLRPLLAAREYRRRACWILVVIAIGAGSLVFGQRALDDVSCHLRTHP